MTTLTQQRIETMQEARQAFCLTDTENDGFRHHLGASQIGDTCARKLWFNFRHAKKSNLESRIIRLFDRGHREEERFISMLKSIGVNFYGHNPETGEQFRVNDCRGHFGGSCDGMGIGFPEYPDEWCLAEFKTHGDKSFQALLKGGVRISKPVHYAQMQVYCLKFKVKKCFYMAVNKNTDELYTEWIYLDEAYAAGCLTKAEYIIFGTEVPERVSETSTYFECRWCDYRSLCFHKGEEPHRSCRSCKSAYPAEDAKWGCEYNGSSDVDYKNPCSAYEKHIIFIRPKDVTISL